MHFKAPVLRRYWSFRFYSKFFKQTFKSEHMGRGDKKTAKGKRFQGSFGKTRPAKKRKVAKKDEGKKA